MQALPKLIEVVQRGPEAILAFVANTPLSDSDDGRSPLVAIFRADPVWPNSTAPEGAPFGYTLKIASGLVEQMFALPACRTYHAIRIVGFAPCLTIEITTDAGVTITNTQELSRRLSPLEDITGPARATAFASLTNAFERPAPRPQRMPFHTRRLGTITPGRSGTTWDAEPINVPFFDNRQIAISLDSAGPPATITPDDAALIDTVVGNYLARGTDMHGADGKAVLALCHDVLQSIGADWPQAVQMLAITDPAAIWAHVFPMEILVYKDDRDGTPSIYIMVLCQCDWEEEHGLQLVHRNGSDLMRVSEQDAGTL